MTVTREQYLALRPEVCLPPPCKNLWRRELEWSEGPRRKVNSRLCCQVALAPYAAASLETRAHKGNDLSGSRFTGPFHMIIRGSYAHLRGENERIKLSYSAADLSRGPESNLLIVKIEVTARAAVGDGADRR